ncbi:hypothetical protein LIER_20049 [Lithospermum erythrorhizon]|uniref:Uncharacterized protein n=1 Tax=Lithospermum erythrorhizon TaxID=34254 RepID=A0AAV3QMS3_LITER
MMLMILSKIQKERRIKKDGAELVVQPTAIDTWHPQDEFQDRMMHGVTQNCTNVGTTAIDSHVDTGQCETNASMTVKKATVQKTIDPNACT